MNKKLLLLIVVAALAVVWITVPGKAQEKAGQKYQYGVLKWDGPDRLYYNLPDRFEVVHLEKKGVKIPSDAQNEEWCLAYGANDLAKDGWEPINLDSRRLLLRRAR